MQNIEYEWVLVNIREENSISIQTDRIGLSLELIEQEIIEIRFTFSRTRERHSRMNVFYACMSVNSI